MAFSLVSRREVLVDCFTSSAHVPFMSSVNYSSDPTHRQVFTSRSFDYLWGVNYNRQSAAYRLRTIK